MVKHVVMWNFADQAEGGVKAANLAKAKAGLDALQDLVPGQRHLEIAIGADGFEHAYDMVLYSEFDTAEALTAYATHPEHVAVASFIKACATARVAFDYEV
ncbi:MAG: Dabb family protein [Propionibacteriaceae bacterium]|jgi:hypothetical protein|nr:Dabb family protein [Propionibacteriaceae bacterium]